MTVRVRTSALPVLTHEGRTLAFASIPFPAPVLTVELSTKWYHLFLVHPDDRVEQLDFGVLSEMARWIDEVPYFDHAPNPIVVRALARERGWYVDEIARELIDGRWVNEGRALAWDPWPEP